MQQSDIFKQAIGFLDRGEINQALATLQPLVDAHNPTAILYYGDILLKQDSHAGEQFFIGYAKQGLLEAYIRLAIHRVFMQQGELDEVALTWLNQAAAQDHLQALFMLLDVYWGTAKQQEVFKKLQHLAPELAGEFTQFLQRHGVEHTVNRKLSPIEKFNSVNAESQATLNESVGIRFIDNVFSPVNCFYIITRFAGEMQAADVVDPTTGKRIRNDVRNSQYCSVSPERVDWFSLLIDLKLSGLTSTDRHQGEPLSLLSYSSGQEYKNHFDFLPVPDNQVSWLADGGQRVKTAICYLNNDFNGGDTLFSRLGLSVKPKLGSVLVFNNTDEYGKLIQDSYHSGEAVTAGEKWITTKWIREKSTPYGRALYL